MIDISTISAIQMLCLIEFATYNIQSIIGTGASEFTEIMTGSCDGVAGLTGRPVGTNGQVDVIYRGIESLYGTKGYCIDGINIDGTSSSKSVYICNCPSNYADDTSINYTKLSYNTVGGYTKTLGLDTLNSHIMLPDTAGGSASTYTCDSTSINTGSWYAVTYQQYVGSATAGLFSYHMQYKSTDSNYNWQAERKMYIPT